jgi:hypothetical protein
MKDNILKTKVKTADASLPEPAEKKSVKFLPRDVRRKEKVSDANKKPNKPTGKQSKPAIKDKKFDSKKPKPKQPTSSSNFYGNNNYYTRDHSARPPVPVQDPSPRP